MTWFLQGGRHGLALPMSSNGVPQAHGDCEHDCRPPSITSGVAKALPLIKKAKCLWSLYGISDPSWEQMLVIAGHRETIKAIRENPESTHAIVTYLPGAPNVVGVTIVARDGALDELMTLLRLVISSSDLEYLLTLDFLGFREPEAQAEMPSIHEWMSNDFLSRRSYVTSLVGATVRPKALL
ncbi:MAG: hypothetical protein ACK55V_11820 [Alphaproteobacteria bacterium]|jgi:hypothetical protein